jgi:hypothetical protein
MCLLRHTNLAHVFEVTILTSEWSKSIDQYSANSSNLNFCNIFFLLSSTVLQHYYNIFLNTILQFDNKGKYA